jgi:hypothetical protein
MKSFSRPHATLSRLSESSEDTLIILMLIEVLFYAFVCLFYLSISLYHSHSHSCSNKSNSEKCTRLIICLQTTLYTIQWVHMMIVNREITSTANKNKEHPRNSQFISIANDAVFIMLTELTCLQLHNEIDKYILAVICR